MTVYYVKPDGNDERTGTSTANAWQTLQYAINKLNPGDTLNVMPGDYDPGSELTPDGWSFKNINGTASKWITIQAYSDTPVLTGKSSGAGSGYPRGRDGAKQWIDGVYYKTSDGTGIQYKLWKYSSLIEFVDCSYLIIDGLQITKSLGQGIEIKGSTENLYSAKYSGAPGVNEAKAAKSHHIIVRNCTINDARSRLVRITNSFDVTIEDCNIYFGSWPLIGGGAGIQLINAHYVNIRRNLMHHLCGETIISRNSDSGHDYDCRNLYITDNISWDCEDGYYISPSEYVIVARNLIYVTPQEKNAEETQWTGGILSPRKTVGDTANAGIVVRTNERDMTNAPIKYVFVIGNIIIGCSTNIRIKIDPDGDGGYSPQGMEHIYILNNTLVNGVDENFLFAAKGATNCVYKNNLSYHTNPKKHVNLSGGVTANSHVSGWTSDYNLYAGSDPQSDSDLLGNLTGSNDQYDADDGLYGYTPPSKGALTLLDQQNGYRVNFNLKAGYKDAGNFAIQASSDALDTGETLTAPSVWNSDGYGASAANWIDQAFDYTNTSAVRSRTGTWDIGADERGVTGGTKPSISSFTANGSTDLTVTTSQSVTFSVSASGGDGALSCIIYTQDPDGSTISGFSGSHTYSAVGYYDPVAVVTDSAGQSTSSTIAVTAITDTGTPTGSVTMDQILTYGGEASVTTTGKAKAMFAISVGATTDDTLNDNAIMSMGVWSAGGSAAASLYAEHGAGTSVARSLNVSGGLLHYITESSVSSGNIVVPSSVTDGGFNLSWPTNHGGFKTLIYTWYGDGVGTPLVDMAPLGGIGSTYSWTGDYNRIIMPAALTAETGTTRRGAISLGMAVRDGNTWCVAYQNANNQTNTLLQSGIYTDRIAFCPTQSAYVAIQNWTSAGGSIIVYGGDVNADTPIMLLPIAGQEWQLGVYDTPTTTGSNTYTSSADTEVGDLGTDGQVFWSMGLLGQNYDVKQEDDTAGVLSFFAADDTNNYTMSIQSDDDAAVSDESSYFADQYMQRNYNGASLSEGTLSIITDGFDINPTTASSTAYKNAYALFEATSGSSGAVASFNVYKSGTSPTEPQTMYSGDTVLLKSTSSAAGGETIDTYSWTVNGAEFSTDVNAEYTFPAPGCYNFTLTITDTGANEATSDTTQLSIMAGPPTITLDYDTAFLSGDGEVPLTCTIDVSEITITPPAGATINKIFFALAGRLFIVAGDNTDDITWYEENDGDYDVTIGVEYLGLSGCGVLGEYREETFTNAFRLTDLYTNSVQIFSNVGPYRTTHQTQAVTFYATVDGETQTDEQNSYPNVIWNFGDDDGVTLNHFSWDYEPTHTYWNIALGSDPEPYTVTVTFWNDTDSVSNYVTGYLTMYPYNYARATTATLADLIERMQNLMAIDFLDGTWVQESSPNTNVWTHTESMPWADSGIYVLEDGESLTTQNSVADCQANAGSYYVSGTSPLVVHVHPTDSGNPNSNGSCYRWQYGFKINVHDNMTVSESASTDGLLNPTVTEAITITESVTMLPPPNPANTEAVGVGESVTIQIQAPVSARNVSVTDAIEVDEGVGVSVV